MVNSELQARLDEMWLRHRPEILERFVHLAAQVRRLDEGEQDAGVLIQEAAHKLVSVLGAFGFLDLAEDAASLERLAQEPVGAEDLDELRAAALRLGTGLQEAARPAPGA